MAEQSFWRVVLAQLGAPATAENLAYMETWAQREGTAAQWNPLATTLQRPGSYPLSGNTAGVQQYPSLVSGATATARTLLGGYYSTIVQGLRSGKVYTAQAAQAPAFARELSTWSGGGYTAVAAPSNKTLFGESAFDRLPVVEQLEAAADKVTGAGTATKDFAVDVKTAALAMPEFLGKITNRNHILRGLQIMAGAVLVFAGVYLLARQIGLAPSSVPLPGAAGRELAGAARQGERQAELAQARAAGRQGLTRTGAEPRGRESQASRMRRERQAMIDEGAAAAGDDIPY